MKKKVVRVVHKPKVAFEVIVPKGKTIGEYLRLPVINLARPAIVLRAASFAPPRLPSFHQAFAGALLDESQKFAQAGHPEVGYLGLLFLREWRMANKFYETV